MLLILPLLSLYDSADKVAQLAKALFTDLSRKQNLLYNALPDVLEKLVTVDRRELSERKLDELLQFLSGFVAKDQLRTRLVERLKEKLGEEQMPKVQQYFKVATQQSQQVVTSTVSIEE